MQYLVQRHGFSEWVSDGEPSFEAIDAALRMELATRIGCDWQEAADELQNHAPDDAERDAALATAERYTDDMLLAAMRRMIGERRAFLAGRDVSRAIGQFIVQVMP